MDSEGRLLGPILANPHQYFGSSGDLTVRLVFLLRNYQWSAAFYGASDGPQNGGPAGHTMVPRPGSSTERIRV
ncbi:unnamed protein product [Boreogadus saida]